MCVHVSSHRFEICIQRVQKISKIPFKFKSLSNDEIENESLYIEDEKN